MGKTTCSACEQSVELVDEHGRCERCVNDAESRAAELTEIEATVAELHRKGMTTETLREVFDLIVSDQAASLRGDLICREPVPMSTGKWVWSWKVQPSSAFLELDDLDEGPSSRLREARASDFTLEELADELGESVETVAAWERGAPIPGVPLKRCAELFGLNPKYLAASREEAAREAAEWLARARGETEGGG